MTSTELAALLRGIAPALRTQIAKAVHAGLGDVLVKLTALEQRMASVRDGQDGKDGAEGPIGPAGADGRDGEPGPKGEPGSDGAVGAPGPQGEPGKDGRDGQDGKDAEPITREQVIDALRSMPDVFEAAVASYLAAHPPAAGKDGRDGRDGMPGPAGEKGLDGKDGLNGKDGRDGIDGKDGADGLGFDDIDVDYDGERSFSLMFKQGERQKPIGPFTLPQSIYRGVYDAKRSYQPGDQVTWGGAMWHAWKASTGVKPGEASDAWQLCVRKGIDGKQGPQGKPGVPGPAGPKGETGHLYRN